MSKTTNYGAVTMIEHEDGLVELWPDPVEQQLDCYLQEQERQTEEFFEHLDLKTAMFSMPCHDHNLEPIEGPIPSPTGDYRYGVAEIEHPHEHYCVRWSYGVLKIRSYVVGWTEYAHWVEMSCFI